MRLLAFAFLIWAAFDAPTWQLDRAGVALVGVAFMALSIGRYHPRPSRMTLPRPKPSPILDANGRVDPALLAQLDELSAARAAGLAAATELDEGLGPN